MNTRPSNMLACLFILMAAQAAVAQENGNDEPGIHSNQSWGVQPNNNWGINPDAESREVRPNTDNWGPNPDGDQSARPDSEPGKNPETRNRNRLRDILPNKPDFNILPDRVEWRDDRGVQADGAINDRKKAPSPPARRNTDTTSPTSNSRRGQGRSVAEEPSPTPETQPERFAPMRGRAGKIDKETGEVWAKDRLHKDHFEVYRNKNDYEKGKRDRSVWSDGRPKEEFKR